MKHDIQSLDFSTILASSIHDMKNSLSMLLNKIDEISIQNIPQQQTIDFDQLKYQGKRVNDHMIQLLVLYRINKTQYFTNINELNIQDFLEEILSQHEPLLEHHGIELTMESDDNLFWYIDRDLISSVITNIMNNLYVYTKSKILVQAIKENNLLLIKIKDDGPGYPEEMLASATNQKPEFDCKSGSTGLGLYFASVAADMHRNKGENGYITTTNDGINNGGCFSIYIP